MDPATQVELAKRFASLHQQGAPLLLPNAWDAGSAAVIANAGAQAIATSSAGVAWSLGLADGGQLGITRSAEVISRITDVVSIPVSADIENGYGQDSLTVASAVAAVINAGAVGINLEDSPGMGGAPLLSPAEWGERIASARAAADHLGIPLWINARTDVYLFGVGEEDSRLGNVLERAEAAAAAGADSLFVPGLSDTKTVAVICDGPIPVSVLVGHGSPSVEEFADAGVVRISLGSSIAGAAYAVAAAATRELLSSGTYATTADQLGYGDLNALMQH